MSLINEEMYKMGDGDGDANVLPVLKQDLYPQLPSGSFEELAQRITAWSKYQNYAAAMLIHLCARAGSWMPIYFVDFIVALVTIPENFHVISSDTSAAAREMCNSGEIVMVYHNRREYLVPTPSFVKKALGITD